MIRFTCEHCHRRLSIADTHAGKAGKCPHCGRPVRIPQPGPIPPEAVEPADTPGAASKWSAQDGALLDIPLRPSTPKAESRQSVSSDEGGETAGAAEGQPEGEADARADVEAPAPFLHALAYPANLDGLVQIAVLIFCLWLVDLFTGLLGVLAGPYGAVLSILGRVVVVGYIVYYIGYCIYDSARGGRRAPTVSPSHLVDLSELISQLLLLIAAVALCFWPAALYRGVAGRIDTWCWTLGATGAFFLPMTLLTAALFDGIDALNPLLILRSILTTLPAYLVLLVKLGVPAGLLLAVYLFFARMPVVRVLAPAAYLYLLLVGAHLLGQFYWRHKDQLKWGL